MPRYAAPLQACVNNFESMPPHRQAALISFAINLGPSRVCGTSIARDLNAGRIRQACDAMTKYVLANGKRLQGLVNRRNDPVWGERPWCLRND
jgi:lysozyme